MKGILIGYLLAFFVFYMSFFYVHDVILIDFSSKSPVTIKWVYMFNFFFSFSLVLLLSFLSNKDRFKDQIGFLYLASMIVKIVLFCFIFRKDIFNNESFTNTEGFNLLIPMILPLFFEILFLSKLLNGFMAIKNDK